LGNSEPKQAQILYFPVQTMYGEDLDEFCDAELTAFHVRLWGTRIINGINTGRLEPTESMIEKLKNINKSLAVLGKPTLPMDFLE